MFRAQRFRLYPNQDQEAYFHQCAGAARHAWNWAIALRQRYYRMFGKTLPYNRLQRQWYKHKKGKKSWAADVGKVVTIHSLRHLESAYASFFAKRSGYPKFKSRRRDGIKFTIADEGRDVSFRGSRIKLPVVGEVRYRGKLRWTDAPIKSATVRNVAGRWFLVILSALPDPKPEPHTGQTCGIDLGCTMFATVSSLGRITEEIAPPKPYAKAKRKLKRLQRVVSRRQKGGKNRKKAVRRLARQHGLAANVRSNFLHQFTSRLVKKYGVIVLEDLPVKGMMGGMLARTVADLGFGEFRRQVTYKSEVTGTKVVFADRWYPSSKTCSHCGLVKTKLELSERTWTCGGCGVTHQRDHNAAFNLEKLGRGSPEVTPAETGGSPPSRKTKRGAGQGSRNAKTTRNGCRSEVVIQHD